MRGGKSPSPTLSLPSPVKSCPDLSSRGGSSVVRPASGDHWLLDLSGSTMDYIRFFLLVFLCCIIKQVRFGEQRSIGCPFLLSSTRVLY